MFKLDKIYNLLERIDNQYRDYTLLTESQESKSISAAKKLVMQKFGWDEQEADEFIRKKLRNDLPVLRSRNGGKFILGATRMFCDGQLRDGGTIMSLNSTLELVASDAHINEYDRNLNGMSALDLINRFAPSREEINNRDREEVGALELQENNDYTIVQIDDFEQARQYGQYTTWCITHDENMINHYTSDGIGQFYFCLKNGFENVPMEKGEGCPLDEYGLSMVAVSVDGDGALKTCTCRWNHDNGGNDNIMNTKQISQLIGRNFYEVFKPNNKWQNALETAIKCLENGEPIKTVFNSVENSGYDNLFKVKLFKKYNFYNINTNQFLSDKWFDYCDVFVDGLCRIKYNEKWNFITPEGTFLSDTGYGYVENFRDCGVAIVYDYLSAIGNENLLRKDGSFVFSEWLDSCAYDGQGIFTIRKYNGEKYIHNMCDSNGRLLLNDWYDYLKSDDDYRSYDIVWVRQNGKKNFINLKNNTGEPVSNEWFDNVERDFSQGLLDYSQFSDSFKGLSMVSKNKEFNGRMTRVFNVLDLNGNLLFDEWLDDYVDFAFTPVGYGTIVKRNEEGKSLENIVYLENNKVILISPNLWFERIFPNNKRELFSSGWCLVKYNNERYNFINTNGKLLLNETLDYARPFKNGIAVIQANNKLNFINPYGQILSPNLWFDEVSEFSDKTPVVRVMANNKENFMTKDGFFLSKQWFDKVNIYDFFEGLNYARCALNGKEYFLSLDGTLSEERPKNVSENIYRKLNETIANHDYIELTGDFNYTDPEYGTIAATDLFWTDSITVEYYGVDGNGGVEDYLMDENEKTIWEIIKSIKGIEVDKNSGYEDIKLNGKAYDNDGSAVGLYFDNNRIVVLWVLFDGTHATSELLDEDEKLIWKIIKSIVKNEKDN